MGGRWIAGEKLSRKRPESAGDSSTAWANYVPKQLKGQIKVWGALNATQPAGQNWWLTHLYLLLMQAHLKYYTQFCNPQYKKCPDGAAKLVTGVEGMSCEEAEETRLSSLEKMWPHSLCSYPMTRRRERFCILLLMTGCTGTAKLHQKRVILGYKNNLFTAGVVKHWNKLPGEVVDVPCSSVQKTSG